jgi:outer membrane protein assembly factor BamB
MAVWAVMLLGGCGTWFGESDGPPLPGDRIAVLQQQAGPTADPQARSEPIVLPPPERNPDWPQAGGDPTHVMQSLQAGKIERPLWQVDIGTGTDSSRPLLPAPVVARGQAFTVDSENVVSAFDASSGKRLWRVDLTDNEDDDDAAPGGLGWYDGRIFITTGFGKVIALDAASGKRVWRRDLGMPVHVPPTVADGRVFVVTVENQLRALSAADGSDVWPAYQALGETARLVGGANPASSGQVLVAPFSSGELIALRADTGRSLWGDSLAPARRTDEISSLAQIRARPAIDGNRVYAISAGGILAAFDLRSGQRLWERDIGGQQSPWIAGRQIYQIDNLGQLLAVSTETGRIHWATKLPAFKDEKERSGPILWSGPVLVGNRLLITGSDGRLLTVSAEDGRVVERQMLADRFTVPPVVADGVIFLLDDDAELSAYR